MSAESPLSAVLSQVCRYWVPLAVSAASQMPLSSARFPLSASRALAQQRAQQPDRAPVGRAKELRLPTYCLSDQRSSVLVWPVEG